MASTTRMSVASYRSDAVPRGHPVRRLRAELRRAGRLREVAVDPLGPAEASLLLKERLGGAPSGRLATAVHDRTDSLEHAERRSEQDD